MREPELLALVERLLVAAEHPEISSVERFDNGTTTGVKAHFPDGTTCYLTVSRTPAVGGGGR